MTSERQMFTRFRGIGLIRDGVVGSTPLNSNGNGPTPVDATFMQVFATDPPCPFLFCCVKTSHDITPQPLRHCREGFVSQWQNQSRYYAAHEEICFREGRGFCLPIRPPRMDATQDGRQRLFLRYRGGTAV